MLSYVTCQMLNVDPRDMLNNFCLQLYAQKSLFVLLCHNVPNNSHELFESQGTSSGGALSAAKLVVVVLVVVLVQKQMMRILVLLYNHKG